jgi:hypothetical protein
VNLVYGLVDPRTLLVRYVGMSKNGLRRPKQHGEAGSLRRLTHRTAWIKTLRSAGFDYTIVVLEEIASTDALANTERFWIAYGRALGWPLTNHTDGGEGLLNPTPETRAKMRASNLGKKHAAGWKLSAETRARISAALSGRKQSASHRAARTGRKHSAESRAKMTASQKARWAKRKEILK